MQTSLELIKGLIAYVTFSISFTLVSDRIALEEDRCVYKLDGHYGHNSADKIQILTSFELVLRQSGSKR